MKIEEIRDILEGYISGYFENLEGKRDTVFVEGMRYAVLGGGKRLRGILFSGIWDFLGGEIDKSLPIATSFEFIHSFSLVHDDIVDKTEVRRGKPSLCKKYGSDIALMIGDALLSETFSLIAKTEIEDTSKSEITKIISDAISKMIEGQIMDIHYKYSGAEEEVLKIQSYKTAALFKVLSITPCIALSKKESIELFSKFGESFGIAFQINDDFMDTEEDKYMKRPNIANVIGLSNAKALLNEKISILWKIAEEIKSDFIKDILRISF